MKVKLASSKKLYTKEGLIHFKRRIETNDDDDAPAAQRPRMMPQHDRFARFCNLRSPIVQPLRVHTVTRGT